MATARASFSHAVPASRGESFRGFAESDPYPMIRSALAPEYADLPAEDVESVLASHGLRAEDMENFFSDVGHAFSSAAQAVAPVAAHALPGALSGALAGCALGPWGCLGGAILGGVGGALSGSGSKSGGSSTAHTIGSIASAIPSIAGSVGGGGGGTLGGSAGASGGIASTLGRALPALAGLAGRPSAPSPGAVSGLTQAAAPGSSLGGTETATNPAGVLLGLLQQPQFLQALMSMSLGAAGRRGVQVGDTTVPTSAFANLGSVLASKAFRQAEAESDVSEDLPQYLYTEGSLTIDPGVPAERAARLLEMLGEASFSMPRSRPLTAGSSLSEADEYYDALDVAELDFINEEGEDSEYDD